MALPRASVILAVTVFLLGVVALLYAATNLVPGPGKPAASTVGGPFALKDQSGQTVSNGTLGGKPFMVFFGFTHCPDICPTTMFEISEALDALGQDADKVAALFMSVDPERDTPEVLGRYVSSFNPRIRALTGSPEEIDAMVKAYRAYYRKVPTEGEDYTMDHTAVVYLMDGEGRFVAPLNMDKTAGELAADIRAQL